MKRTRRNVLSNATKLSALLAGIGASGAVSAESYPEWDPDAVYTGGDRVVYEGSVWEAQWWTQGDEPDTESGPWEELEEGGDENDNENDNDADNGEYPPWDADTVYTGGDRVVYEGYVWEATYWTQGDKPGESEWGPWEEIEEYDDGDDEDDEDDEELTASFSISTQFPDPGEEVEFDAADSEGEIESYDWEFGDGTEASGEVVSNAFDEGQYDVTLTVENADGETDTDSVRITAGRPSSDEKRVVAYYRQWAQYDRDYLPRDIPYDQITHVQYAFARPEEDGTVTLVGDSHGQGAFWDQGDDWRGVDGGTFAEHAAEHDDTKFVLSIGGWGDSEYFSNAALDQENRERFAQSCVEWVDRGNLDGIDLDWEFPGGGGCTDEDPVCDMDNIVREGDQERFTLLCQEVRDHLDDAAENDPDRDEPYELTAAVSANPDVAEGVEDGMNGLEHDKLSDILDFLLVMTFDYRGIWSETTGHHAPLMESSDDTFEDAEIWNAEYALQYWEDQGWDPDQLNMAVPFYGRSWTDVQPPEGDFGTGEDDGLFQEYEGDGADASGDGSYPSWDPAMGSSYAGVWEWFDLGGDGRGNSNNVNLESSEWETYFDEEAVMAWSWNAEERTMISHETEESMEAKMQWLRDAPYGGTMLWAIGGDTYEGDLIGTLWNTLNE
ncbi:PKD domain-containing protein [Natrarchaeobius halalkaliphilus]|uniref:PKD domain-containing protein n=1 Tax=Natrarchaeobius halalkaliphilus TaxID=1679091 RepID=A0A3N6MR13_9EURY|nr:glycosyl hydrolase family 18 protein [Natrarchaeobius halalkaliphilus]RQG86673.1 PKD domain-containing protein [Natrarchaeobius halalkaliphilus]